MSRLVLLHCIIHIRLGNVYVSIADLLLDGTLLCIEVTFALFSFAGTRLHKINVVIGKVVFDEAFGK
jgi:hypothetical protein